MPHCKRQEYLSELTSVEEVVFQVQYSFHLLTAWDEARKESVRSQLPGRDHGPADAYRHVLAAARVIWSDVPRSIEQITRRREDEQFEERVANNEDTLEVLEAARIMDNHNNAVGFDIGARVRREGGDWNDVVEQVRKAMSSYTVFNPSSPQVAEDSNEVYILSEDTWRKNPVNEGANERYKNDETNWNPIIWLPNGILSPENADWWRDENEDSIIYAEEVYTEEVIPGFNPGHPEFFHHCPPPPANITRQLSIPIDPLLLDLDGDGVETVGLNAGIYFDHAGDGFRELTGFVGVDDGLLALDRNGDGIINSGQELFGDSTILENGSLAENGFKALAELDSNGDGIIDANDERFDDLRVFRDLDQDGETDEGELLTLDEAGVVSLSTDYITAQTDYIDPARLIDAAGNAHRQFGVYTNTEGEERALTDVWFTTDLTETIETTIEIPEDIVILPNALGTGNVNSLHQAMVRDSTGELQALVTQFLSAETRAERLSLIEPIIYQWTGQTGGYRKHYDASIDTRKIGALEAFYAYEIQRPIRRRLALIPFPIGRYNRVYRAFFQQLVDVIYYQLSASGHLQLLFDNVTWTQNSSQEWLGDFSRVAEFMFSYATFSPETAADVMQDFAQAIRGVNVHSNDNLWRWRDAIDEFVTSEGISVYPNEAIELVITTLTNVTEEADRIFGGNGDSIRFGLGGDDTLYGRDGDDVLDGRAGNDYLEGGRGNDEYRFGKGYGEDQIYNEDTASNRYDIIRMQGDITADDISLRREGDDLLITINDTSDVLRVVSHFTLEYIRYGRLIGTKRYVDAIIFSDGSILDIGINAFNRINLDSQVIDDRDNELYGTTGADEIDGMGGNDEIYGEDGDDSLAGGAGNDMLSGGAGDDSYIYELGDGIDVIKNQGSKGDIDSIKLGMGILSQDIVIQRNGESNATRV